MAADPRHSGTQSAGRRGAARPRSPWREQLESYLAHHRRTARDAAMRMRDAPLSSLMTGLVIAIALALPVALMLMLATVQTVSSGWDEAARINVYLADEVDLTQAEGLREHWAGESAISEVELIARDEALGSFRERSGLGEALDFLEDNPLPHTLVLTPEARYQEASALQRLVERLESDEYVVRVQLDLEWLQRLNAIADVLERGVTALGLLLGLAVVLVIGNTIRLAIESRRREIVVAKLVGGTEAFVRRPFLYTGLWYGALGGVLAWWLVEVAFWWLSVPVDRLADLYGSAFGLQRLSFGDVLTLVGASMLFGWLGAWLAVKRHLDAIEPR